MKTNKVIKFTLEVLSKNNVGLYIINDLADVVERPDYAATVSWKLVYCLGVMEGVTPGRYGKCNFLTDGWIYPIGEKKDVCDYLNNNLAGDKYRIMTKQELFYIIKHRTNSKQLFYK